MSIGKNVLRVLNHPKYICFRVSKQRNSIIIFPCDYSDPMSYKVPEGIFLSRQKNMRICSKGFVIDTLLANNLSIDTTYTMRGKFYPQQNLVHFDLCDAFENRMDLAI